MSQERAKIHLVPHFHYDPVWIEDQRTYTKQAFELVHQYLDACRQDDGYHLILSELDYLQPFLAVHGEHRQLVRDLIAAGRIGTGGAYCQPNEMSLQGEAIVRNLLYGRLYHEGPLSAKPTVYLPFDVFGHCLQLPQIAAKAGFEAIIWSKNIVGAPPLCYALAPDGTALLQKHEPYWYHPESFQQFMDTVADGLEHQAVLGLRQDLRLLGGDMARPASWLTGRSSELASLDPAIVLSTPEKYLAAVRREAPLRSAVIPLLGRDFSWYHMGTGVTRAELKIANRLAENRLLSAEKWATLAALLGASYPDLALDKAWRQILFGQHHDAITGTSSDTPFLDLLAGYREALDLAEQVEQEALGYIARRANTAANRRAAREGAALLVFNSLGWSRTDVCHARVELNGPLASGFRLTDERGRNVPCQMVARSDDGGKSWAKIVFMASQVPSLGYRTYYLAPARELPPAASSSDSTNAAIENDDLLVRADASAGGCLTSIYDKRHEKELLNLEPGPANEVLALAERPDREMAPWELFTTGQMIRSSDQPAVVQVLHGPVFSQIRIASELADRCGLAQEVTLYRGLPRIYLRTTLLEYRGVHELFALSFPLAVQGAVPTFEDRFAAVVRRASRGRLDFRTLEEQNLSHCGLGSAQNWVDVGPGPSLSITSGNRRVRSAPLGPCTIVTSADLKERMAVRSLEKALLSRGITCAHRLDSDDPESDSAACAFRISLGRKNAYSKRLLELTQPAASRLTEATRNGAWGGVLLRRPDPAGDWPDVRVLVADTNDPGGVPRLAEMLAEAVEADSLHLPEACDFSGLAHPADDYGVALVNRGSLAATLESDGALVALLCHTSAWSTYPWGEGKLEHFFVPEHKSHVFEHALYPHAGDWRRGGVVRVGYEINNPLRAYQVPVQSGPLPVDFSLVTVDAPNLPITTVKPFGNPVADNRTTDRSQPEKAFVLRMYEAEGKPTNANLEFAASPEDARLTDLLERRLGEAEITRPSWRRPAQVAVDVPACSITTLAVRLAPLAEVGPPEELGPTAEPNRPLYCRYWDHNLGAAPMGNQPVTLWMRGSLPTGKNTRFSLGVSNDSRDREISGTVNLIAPSEWTMIPRQVPYRIAPGSQAVYEVMVVVPQDASPCFVRAVTEHGGQVLQDVIPVGDVVPLEVTLAREVDRFVVQMRNPNPDFVEGQIALITPLESWGSAVDTYALTAVKPRLHVFRLDACTEERFAFVVQGDMKGLWAVAKVMWYGRVQYVQEPPPV